MKIRNGFVSNSSSSSFVILGVKQHGDSDKKNLPKGIESIYVEESDYDYVLGIVIDDDEYLEGTSTSFTELQEMAKKISEALNVDINQVELITGTRPS